ncbi:MAG: tRNA (guanosine(46)-N7)-methyltransferase TrmB [Woeseiaceae bacterium]|nr:tRNA (guanosine(46)-N7)-methyltransferase TrmB [Woeseiaceae bacterium]
MPDRKQLINSMREERTIRSFVKRSGRITRAQKAALSDLWPRFGVDWSPRPLDLDGLFGRSAPRVLEIGFGNGESLIEQAAAYPESDFLGIEVHEPGAGHCLLLADQSKLTNLRIALHDAQEVLQWQIPDGSIHRINLYFPDPWPKKRHHKRRILQPDFLESAARKLAPGGSLHIATDWENYALHIDQLLAADPHFRVAERREHSGDNALDRPMTKFEKRGLGKGHRIWDWRLEKISH